MTKNQTRRLTGRPPAQIPAKLRAPGENPDGTIETAQSLAAEVEEGGSDNGVQLSGLEYADGATPLPSEIVVPAGDLDARLAWVREAETQDERAARADVVYTHERTTVPDLSDEELAELDQRFRDAVYLDEPGPGDLPEVPATLTTVDALLDWVYDADDPADDVAQRLRASAVLAAEKAADHEPRKTLVEPLEAFLASEPAQP